MERWCSVKTKNKKGFSTVMAWVIGIAIALLVAAVLLGFWGVLQKAIAGLPG